MSKFTFEEQAKYFEKKLNLKTNSYLDVMGEMHDYFFVVAGANRNEVLLAFREAMDKAVHGEITFEQWQKIFDDVVAKTGWEYNGGRNWRARVIYETNVYAAYHKGRMIQHLDLKDVLPYWEYQHNDSENPRPEHQEWDGLILPAGHDWWRYHYPIKVYGACHCAVIAHDEDDLKMMGKTVSQAPEIEWEEKTVGIRSGNPRVVKVPKGVDVGFEPHNFEKLMASQVENVDKLLMQKMVATSNPQFASLLVDDVLKNPASMALLNQSMKSMVDTVVAEKVARGQIKYVGVIPKNVIEKMDTLNIAPQSSVIAVRDSDILHALRETKQSKGINLPIAFWQNLPEKLRNPKAILLDKSQRLNALLFVYEEDGAKIVVSMDYSTVIKDSVTKTKTRHQLNMITTGTAIQNDRQWESLKGYEILWGEL